MVKRETICSIYVYFTSRTTLWILNFGETTTLALLKLVFKATKCKSRCPNERVVRNYWACGISSSKHDSSSSRAPAARYLTQVSLKGSCPRSMWRSPGRHAQEMPRGIAPGWWESLQPPLCSTKRPRMLSPRSGFSLTCLSWLLPTLPKRGWERWRHLGCCCLHVQKGERALQCPVSGLHLAAPSLQTWCFAEWRVI